MKAKPKAKAKKPAKRPLPHKAPLPHHVKPHPGPKVRMMDGGMMAHVIRAPERGEKNV